MKKSSDYVQLVRELSAFMDGADETIKSAGLDAATATRVENGLIHCLVCVAEEMQKSAQISDPSGGAAPATLAPPGLGAAMPGPSPTAPVTPVPPPAPAPRPSIWEGIRSNISPRMLRWGLPAALGSMLFTRLFSRPRESGGRPYLRNALITGALASLLYPLWQSYRQRSLAGA